MYLTFAPEMLGRDAATAVIGLLKTKTKEEEKKRGRGCALLFSCMRPEWWGVLAVGVEEW